MFVTLANQTQYDPTKDKSLQRDTFKKEDAILVLYPPTVDPSDTEDDYSQFMLDRFNSLIKELQNSRFFPSARIIIEDGIIYFGHPLQETDACFPEFVMSLHYKTNFTLNEASIKGIMFRTNMMTINSSRIVLMNYYAAKVIENHQAENPGKYIVFCGSGHMNTQNNNISGLSEILGVPNLLVEDVRPNVDDLSSRDIVQL